MVIEFIEITRLKVITIFNYKINFIRNKTLRQFVFLFSTKANTFFFNFSKL